MLITCDIDEKSLDQVLGEGHRKKKIEILKEHLSTKIFQQLTEEQKTYLVGDSGIIKVNDVDVKSLKNFINNYVDV